MRKVCVLDYCENIVDIVTISDETMREARQRIADDKHIPDECDVIEEALDWKLGHQRDQCYWMSLPNRDFLECVEHNEI